MRESMIKVGCDRCPRVSYVAEPPPERPEPILELSFGGKRLAYSDLCSSCESTVRRAVAQIRRSGAKVAKKRGTKKEPRVSADSKTRPG